MPLTSLAAGAAAALFALGGLTPTSAPAHQSHGGPLDALAEVSAQRALIADDVAAAKFGTDSPIEDPAREQQILADVRARAIALGIDPDVAVQVFRDHIEASKDVQRALFAYWTAHPESAPTQRPDLGEIRVKLDAITTQLLGDLRSTGEVRRSPVCPGFRIVAEVHVRHHDQLDGLHTHALVRSLSSVCE
ncbi:chorismate mutase family protein [Flindersiella endophytica]